MTGNTLLTSLNFGGGVPVNNGLPLAITRRDGINTTNVDLSGSLTVQDVINKINAADPGNLVASLNAVGNGISLLDNSGTGPLTVDNGELGTALGIAGTEPGSNPAVPLVGQDVNQREVSGSLNILIRLQNALNANDSRELVRINALADKELTRLTTIRGDLGGRLKTLDDVDSRLKDEDLQNQKALSDNYDSDLAEVLTQLLASQTAYQATLKIAAQTLQTSLAQYL
jgi:flagellar hook-associated protein 3 FlgL